MEDQTAKRRRVYSLEPDKIVQSVFTRNYVNYLVPALMKIKEKNTAQDNSHCNFKNVVKYEVDLAMVLSTQGFAWSTGLKLKLQKDHDAANAAIGPSFQENEAGEGSSNLTSKCKEMKEMEGDIPGEDNEDENIIKNQLRSLRRLIPGGEMMCDEQMVAELESYITCLQVQVNVLQCLLAETG